MQGVLLVGAGGFAGTVCRYLLMLGVRNYIPVVGASTFAVNLLGSFLIGIIYGLGAGKLGEQGMAVLAVGFLGGFTTYSAFSMDTVFMLQHGQWAGAISYMFLMLTLCLAATFLGISIA